MINTLKEQRYYFDAKYGEIRKSPYFDIAVPKSQVDLFSMVDLHRRKNELLEEESLGEFSYRSGIVRGVIIGRGLGSHMDDIIDGMNQSSAKFIPFEQTFTPETFQDK